MLSLIRQPTTTLIVIDMKTDMRSQAATAVNVPLMTNIEDEILTRPRLTCHTTVTGNAAAHRIPR